MLYAQVKPAADRFAAWKQATPRSPERYWNGPKTLVWLHLATARVVGTGQSYGWFPGVAPKFCSHNQRRACLPPPRHAVILNILSSLLALGAIVRRELLCFRCPSCHLSALLSPDSHSAARRLLASVGSELQHEHPQRGWQHGIGHRGSIVLYLHIAPTKSARILAHTAPLKQSVQHSLRPGCN